MTKSLLLFCHTLRVFIIKKKEASVSLCHKESDVGYMASFDGEEGRAAVGAAAGVVVVVAGSGAGAAAGDGTPGGTVVAVPGAAAGVVAAGVVGGEVFARALTSLSNSWTSF